jgi:TRAP transporter TAXI family solute receptor
MALLDGKPVAAGMGGAYWVRAVMAVALLSGAQATAGQDDNIVTIATAGHGGVYLPAGNAICRLVNAERERHGIRCIARASAGSVENIEALRTGERAYAIVQSDIQNAALKGSRQFAREKPLPELRVLFSLHAEPFTVVVAMDSDIKSFAETRERRINLGVEGSGMRATAEDVLKAFGFSDADPALVSYLLPDDEVEALCEGRIEVVTFVVGHPSGYVQDATDVCDGRLVPVEGPAVQQLLANAPYYSPATIAAQTYRDQPQDVPTFGVRATVVTLAERPEAEVYELVKAVFSNLDLFRRLHPALADLDRTEMVAFGNTAPLHSGAERYYREVGLR